MLQDVLQVPFSQSLAEHIRSELNTKGFYCMQDAIAGEALQHYRNEVKRLVQSKGQRYLMLINPYDDPASTFHQLKHSTRLKTFLHQLAQMGCPRDVSGSKTLNVLRVVTGKKTQRESLRIHYDATVVTALLPILIPDGAPEQSGHLVALPNCRAIRRFALHNILEKVAIQNRWSQRLLAKQFLKNQANHVKVLEPGNLYFFWGYRSLHANLPINPKAIRATLMFHHGDPHKHSWFLRGVAKFRHFRETLNAQQT